ncbi:hypothetical protein AX14_012676 [Amanita brunnescens Koide BX004]|nr:hypothetical protein AX14_012676 [Amanita brunnescens Koide BX004]
MGSDKFHSEEEGAFFMEPDDEDNGFVASFLEMKYSEKGNVRLDLLRVKKEGSAAMGGDKLHSEEEGAFFMEPDDEDDGFVALNQHGDDVRDGHHARLRAGGDAPFCESCVYAKAKRVSVPKDREGPHGGKIGDEVHPDLYDAIRSTHLYLMRVKSETFGASQKYAAWCETQLEVKIKILHWDRGGEYMDSKFIDFLKKDDGWVLMKKNEGEDNISSIPRVSAPIAPQTKAHIETIVEPRPATLPPVSEHPVPLAPASEPDPPARHIRKPSQCILDIIEGRAVTSLPKPVLT